MPGRSLEMPFRKILLIAGLISVWSASPIVNLSLQIVLYKLVLTRGYLRDRFIHTVELAK